MKKKTILVLTVMILSSLFLFAQGGSEERLTEDGRQIVTYWYYHKGNEATIQENAIARFNASQDEYFVEGFSVPDKQKYLVAMASDESPDVIALTNAEVISYQTNGLLEDMKMFYNKDLLASIGETEPPTTMEELFEMAEKATTLDADGNIDILGYPLFPLASARQELIYAFGGRWAAEDGVTPTANCEGNIKSLEMNMAFREKYGVEKVQRFVATGNTNRYTPQDIFFAGKQLFRFDGPWFANNIKQYNPDINFGVAMVPGTEADPELLGVSRYENTSLAIPVVAKEKDGAYAFISWFVTEGAKDFLLEIGSLPANNTLYDDPDLLASNEAFPSFMEALKTGNGIEAPRMDYSAEYISMVDEYLDYIYNGTMGIEDALNELQAQAEAMAD